MAGRFLDWLKREAAGEPLSDAEALARLIAAKDAAEAANEAKTRFLASVSHEIRSPLNAIYGYAQLLERGGEARPDQAGKVIRRSSEHLANLVDGLLDIAQVEGGALKLSREAIRFPEFLAQLIAMLNLQAQARGIALVLDHPPGLPEFVHADPKRLRQVLINLLTNAIKFTDHGSVTLKVEYRNQLATFTVIAALLPMAFGADVLHNFMDGILIAATFMIRPELGLLTALAGILLAAKLRIGQASVGLEYLLPALVGAFLGSTTIKPGRVNVWGTIVGVMILAVGISGIQQFGGSFWVEPLFNGTTLLIAIGIAGYAQRKKGATSK